MDNPRRALQPTAILFADGGQDERREMWVSSLQIREGRLSNAEIEALGGPSADGIPIVIQGVKPEAQPPTLKIAKAATTGIVLSWEADTVFVLETKARLSDSARTAVPGASGNQVTITPGAGSAFYRLRQ